MLRYRECRRLNGRGLGCSAGRSEPALEEGGGLEVLAAAARRYTSRSPWWVDGRVELVVNAVENQSRSPAELFRRPTIGRRVCKPDGLLSDKDKQVKMKGVRYSAN